MNPDVELTRFLSENQQFARARICWRDRISA